MGVPSGWSSANAEPSREAATVKATASRKQGGDTRSMSRSYPRARASSRVSCLRDRRNAEARRRRRGRLRLDGRERGADDLAQRDVVLARALGAVLVLGLDLRGAVGAF